jgi:hypothetical protein
MALPLAIAPIVYFGLRAALLGTAGWFAGRMVTEHGDPKKAVGALRADMVRTYEFFTKDQTTRLKDAGDTLQKNGGNLATFATALLALVEFVSGIKLSKTKHIVTQTRAVLDAYGKLSPADKKVADAVVTPDVKAILETALAEHMYTLGQKTLQNTHVEGMTLTQYLNQKYTALYYIGRSKHQLTAKEVDSLADTMIHLHTMIKGKGKKKEQGPMIQWYQSVGVGVEGADLIDRLKACPEVRAIGKDDAARYIAYALRHPVPGLTFGGIAAESAEQFTM